MLAIRQNTPHRRVQESRRPGHGRVCAHTTDTHHTFASALATSVLTYLCVCVSICYDRFETLEGAKHAKEYLNNAEIYTDCCKLGVSYAKVRVFKSL